MCALGRLDGSLALPPPCPYRPPWSTSRSRSSRGELTSPICPARLSGSGKTTVTTSLKRSVAVSSATTASANLARLSSVPSPLCGHVAGTCPLRGRNVPAVCPRRAVDNWPHQGGLGGLDRGSCDDLCGPSRRSSRAANGCGNHLPNRCGNCLPNRCANGWHNCCAARANFWSNEVSGTPMIRRTAAVTILGEAAAVCRVGRRPSGAGRPRGSQLCDRRRSPCPACGGTSLGSSLGSSWGTPREVSGISCGVPGDLRSRQALLVAGRRPPKASQSWMRKPFILLSRLSSVPSPLWRSVAAT